ncbi:adenosylcobinamide-GDP ribazoletransferase [Bacillota bacterium LX-D]|nr:adenosylcobinamide-GDP ribazoletransferase [Bacillota bacterium LX-D]
MKQLKSFLSGVQFLTRIPCPTFTFESIYFVQALLYYPVVGLLIGAILVGEHYILSPFLTAPILSVILLISYVLITGGLHLDGLTDTADGIFSHRSRERVLEIMKDSRVGAHGVTAAVVTLLFKYSLYLELSTKLSYPLFLSAFILSRWGMVLLIHYFPYLRAEGLGKLYAEGNTKKQVLGSTLLTLLFLMILNWKIGLILIALVCLATWVYGRLICNFLGGFTGDTYGAYAELTEVYVLLLALLILSLM